MSAAVYLFGIGLQGGAMALGQARSGLPGFAREVTPYLFAPVPVLLAGSMILRARAALLLSMVAVLPLIARCSRRVGRRSGTAAGPRFRALTLNGGGNAHGSHAGRLLRTLATVDADVVALQELTPALLAVLRRELASRYPQCAGTYSAVVFSRFPLRGARTLSFHGRGSDAQRVELQIGGRWMTLFNVHVTRPGYQLWGRRGIVRFLRFVGEYDPSLRDAHTATIKAQLREVRGPILVTGDLNGTEWSHAYRLLSAGLVDSFREVGRGFGHTYRARLVCGSRRLWLPLLRIDYIFHSPELVALHARIGAESGSDHLPVVAELAFHAPDRGVLPSSRART